MFLIEKLFYVASYEVAGRTPPNPEWWVQLMEKDSVSTEAERKKTLSERKKYFKDVERMRRDRSLIAETGFDSTGERHYRLNESVCDSPDGGASVYQFNDTFIELRTPYDEKRGFITLLLVLPLALLYVMLPDAIMVGIPSLIYGTNIAVDDGEPLPFMGYMTFLMSVGMPLGLLGALLRWGTSIIRLECLTQRRLLVRFNRKTRKVYIHYPKSIGGVREFDWDKAIPGGIFPQGDEAEGVGMFLMLAWQPDDTPSGVIESVMIGRPARSNSEIVNLWEFIRRYMEEGPQAVPKPKLIGKFPWPWRSIEASASLVWPIFEMASLRWMLPLVVLISPIILVVATAHWISLLTCWEPRWPKAIREACGGQ